VRFQKTKERLRRVNEADLEPARYLELGLASWLLISAYLWPHTGAQFLVTVAVGALIAIVAPFAVGSPRVRQLIMGAGAFLMLAAVAIPHTDPITLWHNAVMGFLFLTVAYFGPPHGIVPARPEAPADAYEATGGV
jgi:hypothetical protein